MCVQKTQKILEKQTKSHRISLPNIFTKYIYHIYSLINTGGQSGSLWWWGELQWKQLDHGLPGVDCKGNKLSTLQ